MIVSRRQPYISIEFRQLVYSYGAYAEGDKQNVSRGGDRLRQAEYETTSDNELVSLSKQVGKPWFTLNAFFTSQHTFNIRATGEAIIWSMRKACF